MGPSVGRALETLAGPWLAPLAATLRLAATLAGIVAVSTCALRAGAALAAWNYGWETRMVVVCRRCGLVVADPSRPTCPEGHPVRFPPTLWHRAATAANPLFPALVRVWSMLLPVAAGILATWGYFALGVGDARLSSAAICSSCAYLFLAGSLISAVWALSPGSRNVLARAFHAAVAALLLPPVAFLFLMAQTIEPPVRRPIGAMWRTPTALYLSAVTRAGRRVAPPVPTVQASIVEARVPVLGIVWQGLASLRAGGTAIDWKGRGGVLARGLERWSAPLSKHGVWLSRFEQGIDLPTGSKIWIVQDRRRLVFIPEENLSVPEIPAAPSPSGRHL